MWRKGSVKLGDRLFKWYGRTCVQCQWAAEKQAREISRYIFLMEMLRRKYGEPPPPTKVLKREEPRKRGSYVRRVEPLERLGRHARGKRGEDGIGRKPQGPDDEAPKKRLEIWTKNVFVEGELLTRERRTKEEASPSSKEPDSEEAADSELADEKTDFDTAGMSDWSE